MPSSLAKSSVATHLRILRMCGYCKLHRSSDPTLRYFHNIYCSFIMLAAVTYILQQAIYAYLRRSDLDLLAQVMFLLLCHLTSLGKQFVFYIRADDIEAMVDDFNDPLFNQTDEHAQNLLQDMLVRAIRLLKLYATSGNLTIALWTFFSVINHYQGKHVEFTFWMGGMDSDKPVLFELHLIYSCLILILVAFGNITMDTFINTTLYQSQTQLKIVRYNLEKLPDKYKSIRSKPNYDKILQQDLVQVLYHYKKACRVTTRTEDIFSIPILIQFSMGGWILCMAAFKMVDYHFPSVQFASMALFIFCILLELFIYCYFGNEASVESNLLTNSIYAMNWVDTPVWFQKSLVIIMERAKRPLRPTAGGIIPLSLDTYVKILKSSYTFYAVLRQTK